MPGANAPKNCRPKPRPRAINAPIASFASSAPFANLSEMTTPASSASARNLEMPSAPRAAMLMNATPSVSNAPIANASFCASLLVPSSLVKNSWNTSVPSRKLPFASFMLMPRLASGLINSPLPCCA